MTAKHDHDGEINAFKTDDRGLVIHQVGNENAWIKSQDPVDLSRWA